MSATIAAFLAGAAGTMCYGMYTGKSTDEGDEAVNRTSRSLPSFASSSGTGFMSDMLAQMWPYINVAASKSIKDSVEPQFKDLPGPLGTLHFTKVNLGHVPLRLDNIIVHEVDRANNTLQMDMDVRWDGVSDIQLKANYLGSFGVKSIKLFGRMTILLKPMVETLSLVEAVQVAFVNPPEVRKYYHFKLCEAEPCSGFLFATHHAFHSQMSLDFVGLANVADLKVLKRRITDLIGDNIKAMMVLPNRMLTKLDMACSFMDIYQPPLGVCRMKLHNGKGFKVEKRALRSADIPDVFVNLSLGDATCKSKVIKDNVEPVWDETMDFVLSDHDQFFEVNVFDEDTGALDSDDFLGSARGTVGDILLSGGKKEYQLREDKQLTGSSVNLGCELLQFTKDLSSLNTVLTGSSEICGMVTILVTQAFALPVPKEEVASFVKVTCGKQEFVTGTVTDYPGLDSLNPFFDMAFHVPLTADKLVDKKIKNVCLSLMNKEKCLGTIEIDHAKLVDAPDRILTEKKAIGPDGASLEYRIILRGVQGSKSLASAVAGSARTMTSSEEEKSDKADATKDSVKAEPSSVRVTMVKGSGFQVKHRRFKKDDVPDIYCITKFGSSPTPWRTATIKNSITPEWNESETYPLQNHNQIVNVEVWEANSGKHTKDDLYGSARVTVGKVLLAGGSLDVEVHKEGKPLGLFVTIRCELK